MHSRTKITKRESGFSVFPFSEQVVSRKWPSLARGQEIAKPQAFITALGGRSSRLDPFAPESHN